MGSSRSPLSATAIPSGIPSIRFSRMCWRLALSGCQHPAGPAERSAADDQGRPALLSAGTRSICAAKPTSSCARRAAKAATARRLRPLDACGTFETVATSRCMSPNSTRNWCRRSSPWTICGCLSYWSGQDEDPVIPLQGPELQDRSGVLPPPRKPSRRNRYRRHGALHTDLSDRGPQSVKEKIQETLDGS